MLTVKRRYYRNFCSKWENLYLHLNVSIMKLSMKWNVYCSYLQTSNKYLNVIAVCCFWFGKLQSSIETTRLEAISYYTSIYLFPLNWMSYYLFSGDSHVETFQWNGIKLLKIVVPRWKVCDEAPETGRNLCHPVLVKLISRTCA